MIQSALGETWTGFENLSGLFGVISSRCRKKVFFRCHPLLTSPWTMPSSCWIYFSIDWGLFRVALERIRYAVFYNLSAVLSDPLMRCWNKFSMTRIWQREAFSTLEKGRTLVAVAPPQTFHHDLEEVAPSQYILFILPWCKTRCAEHSRSKAKNQEKSMLSTHCASILLSDRPAYALWFFGPLREDVVLWCA